jgi:hypothetical protein
MCYFHVVNCCKKKLRSNPTVTQKMICEEVYFLHTSVSQVEFEARYAEVAIKWRRDFTEFARYFAAQCFLGNFTNWKIYCSEPGIASTNNALESFNNIIQNPTPLTPGIVYWHLWIFLWSACCLTTPWTSRT